MLGADKTVVLPSAPANAGSRPPSLLLRARTHPGMLAGGIVLLVIVLAAVFAPLLAPGDPYAQNLLNRRAPPVWFGWLYGSPRASWMHPFGTDAIGRDYLSRLIYGSRISLVVATVATALSAVIGITLGLVGGYYGKTVDSIVSFVIMTRLSMPLTLVALAVVALYGGSTVIVVLVLGLLLWDRFAVVIRAETQRLREAEYVRAAKAIGCSTPHLLFRQILPNLTGPLVVVATYEMGIVILTEAGLSFLGMGVQPPTPSWGQMLSEARAEILFHSWMIVLPGVAIFILVYCINLVGDGLRDILEPRGRA